MAFAGDWGQIRELTAQLVSADPYRIEELVNQDPFPSDQIDVLQEACVRFVQVMEQLNNTAKHMEQALNYPIRLQGRIAGQVIVLEDEISELRESAATCRQLCHDPAALRNEGGFKLLHTRFDSYIEWVNGAGGDVLDAAAKKDFSMDTSGIDDCNAELLKNRVSDRAPFSFVTNNGYLFIDPEGNGKSWPELFTDGGDPGKAVMKRARIGAGKIQVTEGNAAYFKYGIERFSDKTVVNANDEEV